MANPFDDYKSSHVTTSKTIKSYTTNNIEDEAEYYEREMEKYMQESLDSTERSRQHLESSEQLGAQTAKDLLEQREKLEKTETNLDNIYQTTQHTQRNLNSLKSVFGGFVKNKFSRKPQEPTTRDTAAPSVTSSKSANHLSSTVATMSTGGSSASFSGPSSGTLSESSRATIQGTRWEAMDNQIDENLDMMAANLRNLKGLGEALGKEVEDQNQMLDRIHNKADRNDVIVRNQDKQMQKLLGAADASSESSSAIPSVGPATKMSLAMKLGSFFK